MEGHPELNLNTTQCSAKVEDCERDQSGEFHAEGKMEQGKEAEQSDKVNSNQCVSERVCMLDL